MRENAMSDVIKKGNEYSIIILAGKNRPRLPDPPVPVSTENSQGSRRGRDEPVEADEEVAWY